MAAVGRVGWFVTGLFLLFASDVFAEARKVKFKSDNIPLSAAATKPFSLDLRTLLSEQGTGTLTWAVSADKPAWLTLNSAQSLMTGTPSLADVATTRFRLSVQDGDSGALAQITMTVSVIPIWKEDPINLGFQKEDSPWTFDLKTKVTHPAGGTLTFRVEIPGSLPSWMSLSTNGILSGTPRRVDVGPYRDIAFIATTESGGSARAEAFGEVQKTIHPPVWISDPQAIDDAYEDLFYTKNVSGFVLNFEQQPLSFRLVQGAPTDWIKISSTGELTGVPGKLDVGPQTLKIEVSSVIDGQTYASTATFTLKVIHTNHTPEWTINPIVLPEATTGIFYTQSIASLATDPDGDPLKFSLIDGPAWATLSESGVFSGTPQKPDVGENTWTVAVSDLGFSPRATLRVKVIKANEPPQWLNKPTVAKGAKEDFAYDENLIPYVTDPDNDPVTFTLVAGPSWVTISPQGRITGTPGKADVGLNKLTVKADDKKSGFDIAEVQIAVEHTNHTPVINEPALSFQVKEREVRAINLAPFVSDSDGDPLTYSLVNPPGWASITSAGQLTLQPLFAHIGHHQVTLQVSDGGFSPTGIIKIEVVRDPRPPVWLEDPIAMSAKINVDFAGTLAGKAKDLDGLSLSFSKKSGPAWLSVAADGTLSGKPAKSDIGDNTFVVTVKNDLLGADAKLVINVFNPNKPPVVDQAALSFQVKEREVRQENLTAFVTDPNGDPLSFTLIDTPSWVTLASDGKLTLKPLFAHIGDHQVKFQVTDGEFPVQGTLNIKVLRDPRPPVWLEDPIKFTAKIDLNFSESLAGKAKDLDGLALTFSKKSGPAWLTVAANGALSGKPTKAELGDNTFVVTVKNDLLGADATLVINVFDPNQAPSWTQNPITLPNAKEKQAYLSSVASFATDPDPGDVLTFSKVSGPSWASVSATGAVTGTPARTDVGLNTFVMRVTDKGGKTADVTVNLTVEYVNQAPRWTQNPLVLPNAFEDVAFSSDVSLFAVDDDGDALSFRKVTGPSWLLLSGAGKASGTPGKNDVGDYTGVFEVSDGKLVALVDVRGKVIHTNHTPVINDTVLSFQVKEREVKQESLSIGVNDPDGDPLTYTLVSTSDWVTLSSDGKLTLKPLFKHIGDHQLTFKVSDGEFSPQGVVKIKVLRDPRPPVWLEDPIKLSAKINVDFTGTLAGKAKDLDGLPLTYAKKSGPAWLSVAADGTLSGKPAKSDIGDNTFIVTARNDLLGADATLIINVFNPNKPPVIDQPALSFQMKEREVRQENLTAFVSDPNGDTLTFSLIDTPEWVTLAGDGKLTLKPLFAHIGDHQVRFRVTDGEFPVDGVLAIKVSRNPRPPVWLEDPIHLSAKINVDLTGSLADKAKDLDGLALTFSKKSGPAWLAISPSGVFSGKPAKSDIGDNTFVVTVKNDLLGADATLVINVFNPNKPPVIDQAALSFQMKEREVRQENLVSFVTDPNGDPLAFSLIDTPSWVTLASDGKLTLTPLFAHIGDHQVKFQVTDGEFPVEGVLRIKVLRDPRPPVWLEDPIKLSAKINVDLTGTLADKAKDLDGLALTFSKKSGPAWLAISPSGALSGKPTKSELGDNAFVVTVKNDLLGADATLVINVYDPNQPPVIDQAALSFQVKEREVRLENLTQFVTDPDGDPLLFTLLDTSEWVTLAGDGKLTLKPLFKHIGDHQVRFTVTDGSLSAEGVIRIKVLRDPRPPVWLEDPIKLSAKINVDFTATVADKAKDLDGLALTFSKKSGPAWLSVAADGTLSGKPAKSDIGDNAFVVTVKNDLLGADVQLVINVFNPNNPPVIDHAALSFQVKEREVRLEDVANFVTDPNGDALTFSLLDASDWLTLAGDGKLTLKPLFKHIGDHQIAFRVTDGEFPVDGMIRIKVLRDPRPPVWLEDPINLTAKIDVDFSGSLASKAKDLDGLAVTFSKKSGPSWLTVAANGALSGKPTKAELGDNTFVVTVRNDLLGADAQLVINVFDPNQAPSWTQNPITLPNAKEKQAYLSSVASFATDPDLGDVLTFSKVSGPSWASVSATGAVTGTPARTDVGLNTFIMRVTDKGGKTADVTVNLTVEYVNQAPRWTQNPLVLPNAFEDVAFSSDVSLFAVDDDGDALSFRKVTGPSWLLLSGAGKASGTPGKTDVGDYTGVFEVSDGKLVALVDVQGKVIHTNHTPVINDSVLSFQVKEREVKQESLTIGVNDPDGDPLTYTLVSTSDWVTLSSDGKLTLKPLFKHIGDHQLTFKVSDGEFSPQGVVKIKVLRDPRPPVWLEDPIKLTAKINVDFTGTLAGKAKDLDGLPLTYAKKSGPAWLSVAADGTLSGKPVESDIGDNTFIVTASNDLLGADGTLIISVFDPNLPPVINQEALSFQVKEREVRLEDLTKFVSDPNGDTLTFSLLDTPEWVTLAGDGKLTLKPLFAHIGDHQVRFTVTDGKIPVTGTIRIKVLRDPRPPVWLEDPIKLSARVNVDFVENLATKAKDLDGLPVTFSKKSGPAWLTVSANGSISGRPTKANLGDNTFIVTVRNDLLGSDVTLVINVFDPNQPPVIDQAALSFQIKEREVRQENLASFVTDPDGDPLAFALIDTPDWITLATDGKLTMKPLFKHIGEHQVKFSVTDGSLTANGVIRIKVLRDPRPPVWLEDPIKLSAKINIDFTGTLAGKAKDLDGLPLTYAKKSGPAWLSVAADGTLSGKPAKSDIGDNTFIVTVSNDLLGADGTLVISVFDPNQPPVIDQAALSFQVKEREVRLEDVAKFVTDPNGDALTFSLLDTTDWVTLAADGKLALKPLFKHIGDHQIRFRVTDGELPAEGVIRIKVLRNPRPPVWLEDPIKLSTKVNVDFTATLAGKAKDLDGLPITFAKTSGPAWLSIAADGTLSGKPAKTDLGDNTFVVTVKNDLLGATAQLVINVFDPNQPPVIDHAALSFQMKEREVRLENLTAFVTDPNGDPLSFALFDASDWITLATDGKLTMKPLFKHIGDHQVRFSVTDGAVPVSGVIRIKVLRDPRPPVWLEDPIKLSAKIDTDFTATLADKAKDLDGLALTFSKKSGPAWLTVAANGSLTGKPSKAELGDNTFVVTVRNDLLGADAQLVIHVFDPNQPPAWIQDPITLPNAKEKQLYTQSISSFATDPDPGDQLTFSKVSGPSWATITPQGGVIGTPARSDVGLNVFVARVTDRGGKSADVTVKITVEKVNVDPKWTQDPIPLGDIPIDKLFIFNLAPFAVDADGDPLTFQRVSGPAWLMVASNGQLSGTPKKSDLGEFVATVTVSDGGVPVPVGLFGKVYEPVNQPPKVVGSLFFITKERATLNVALADPKLIMDPDGDALTFAIAPLVSWVSMTAGGDLTAKPLHPQIGDHSFALKITDSKGLSTNAPLFIRVLPDPQGLSWLQDPIRFTTTVNLPFSASVASFVNNPSGGPLTFSKKGGPAWLSVAANGLLSGVPKDSDLGENNFVVMVHNGTQGADVGVVITVKQSTEQTDTVQVDQAVPGAKAENLWVVDNSWQLFGYDELAKLLKQNIQHYYHALATAGIHHVGAFLSSDGKKDGAPIIGSAGNTLIKWSDPDPVKDFRRRVDAAEVKKCFNSPIWSMFRFYERLPLEDYFEREVPMDALIVTRKSDYYKKYAADTAQEDWRPEQYATHFIEEHSREKKSYRVSAIAPECPKLENEWDDPSAAGNPYKILVDKTKGTYYMYDCNFKMKEALEDYASKVVFRAYVHAKKRIKLSKKPSDVKSIRVFLGGQHIPGNAGNPDDKWYYDATTNEIVIQWHLIDLSGVKPGAKLEIKYRV